jgi:heptosyltransferase-2
MSGPYVVLAPGSRWGTKRWPYFAELARLLAHPVVIIGGPEDEALAQAIVAVAPERCHSVAGHAGLRASAAIVERAALVVSNDSVALHLATALDRPVVALFGPTIPAFGFGPLGNDPIVEQPLPCRPCSSHGPATCPLGHHRCMREIDAARVGRVVEERLAVRR